MKTIRVLKCIISLGLAVIVALGIYNGEITLVGRHRSHELERINDPFGFWLVVSLYSIGAVYCLYSFFRDKGRTDDGDGGDV
jgi:hypothetical protein